MPSGSKAGDVYLDVSANTKPFQSQMNGLQGQVGKIGKLLAGALTVKAFANFGKNCLQMGSDLAEVQNVVDVSFSHMAGKVDQFAKSAASQFGLSETMAKQYVGTFGAMSKSFGFTEKEAYNMSTALTGLAGDVASFYNIAQDEAYTKLKSVFTGETETLKELGVVMTQSALDQYAMANGFGKTTSAMTEQEKVALRYQFVMNQLSLASGDFARTQDSWANQTRLLSLQFQSLSASIGQGLINVLTPAIKALNAFMGKLIQAANVFSQFTAKLMGKKAEKGPVGLSAGLSGVGASAGNASSGLGSMGSSADKAGKSAKKAAKNLKKAQKDIMGFDKINKLASKNNTNTGGAGGGGGTGGGVGGGSEIAGLNTETDKASKSALKLGKIWDNLRAACGRLKKAFAEFWGIMKSAGKWVLDNILKPLAKWTISELAPRLVDLLAAAFRVLSKVLKALEPAWKVIWKVLFKPLAKLTGKVITKALDLLIVTLNKVADFAEKHPKTFSAIVQSLLGLLALKKLNNIKLGFISSLTGSGGLLGFEPSLLGKITGRVLDFGTKAGSVFTKLGPIATKGGAVLKKVLGGMGKVFSALGKAIMAHPIIAIITGIAIAALLIYKNWDKIKKTKFGKALIKAGKILKNFGNYLKGGLINSVKRVTGTITAFKKVWDGIKSKTAELGADIKEKVKGDLESFSNMWESVKDKTAELTASIVDKASSVREKLKETWDSIKDRTASLVADAKEKTAGMIAKLKEGWESVKDKTAELKADIKQKWADLKTKWTNITKNIANKTAYMKAAIGTKWSNIKAKWQKLMSHFKGKTASIGLKFSAAAKDLKDWINTNVIDKINAKFRQVPILKNHLIRHLAQGGFVKKNTPQLAMIGDNRHQGEVVAPEDKLLSMAKKAAELSTGGTSPEVISLLKQILVLLNALDLDVYLDGASIKRNVVKRINDHTKATGQLEIII